MNNTMHYAYLIKNLAVHKRVAKKQKIKTILFWLVFPLLGLYFLTTFLPEKAQDIAIMVFGFVFLAYIVAEFVFFVHFFSFLNKKRKEQLLSDDDQTDRYFLRLNQKFSLLASFIKKVIIGTVAAGAVGLVLLVTFVVLGAVTGNDSLSIIGILFFVLFFIAILAGTLAITFKQMSFARNACEEVEQIRQYFNKLEGLSDEQVAAKKRNIITNVYENQRALTYLYPDAGIRKRVMRLSFVYIMPITFLGGGFGGIAAISLLSEKYKIAVGMSIAFVVVLAIFITLYMLSYFRLVRAQRLIFEADAERYKHHITLADLTKINQRQSNMASIATTAFVVLICVVLCLTVAKTAIQIGIIVFCGLIAWLIAYFAVFIPLFKTYRKKAKQIEHLIDKDNELLAKTLSDGAFDSNKNDAANGTDTTNNNDLSGN